MGNRRTFLNQAFIGTTSLFIFKSSSELTKSSYKILYVKESNFTLTASLPTVIGFLYTDYPDKIESHINKLRIKNHYRRRLSYRSNDKYKLNFTKDLIDYFFNEPSLYFYARLVNAELESERTNINLVHDIVYEVNYKKAISDLKEATKSVDFYLECKLNERVINYSSKEPESYQYSNFHTGKQRLVEYLNKYNPSTRVILKSYKKNNLSQLNDFLTGCIYGDMVGIENHTKRDLLNYLKRKLTVNKLSELYNSKHNKKFIISGHHK